jgi:tRNA pseudouridine55 synthase
VPSSSTKGRNWLLLGEPKEYEATLSLGEETNTDDLTGKVTGRKPLEGITAETIDAAFRFFTGKILQVPPMFSAIKINGRPLYELARKGGG